MSMGLEVVVKDSVSMGMSDAVKMLFKPLFQWVFGLSDVPHEANFTLYPIY